MDTYKYLLIGGGMAGGRAAEGIRKVDPAGPLALVAGEPYLPYDRPPLSKGYLTGEEGLDKVYLRPAEFYTQNQITVLQGVRATALAPAARRVTLADGRVLGYEKLLLATGGTARTLAIPGAGLPGLFTLRTLADADAIRAAAQPGKRAVVVGGSFIGSEAAAALAVLGLEVTMVFPGARLLDRVLPPELSAWLHGMYTAHGVRFCPGRTPARLEGAGRVERAVLDDGTEVAADLVVAGIGVTLDTELARAAGLALDEKGAVRVDEFLRTSDPSIYAAGDIASWPDPTLGKRLRVEHWDVARQQGLRAGRNMAGEEQPYTAVPYFYSDLFHYALEAWGDLAAWERTVQRGTPESGHFFLFYFYQDRLAGILVGNPSKEERKLLPALVRTHWAYDDVAARLADERVGLEALGEVASSQ
jgi:3-phenylpropionate/trans-cinnamate dioxygenase ferredoxin reductase subunit